MLDGRVINVELTAGGGGKSETRLTKVRERNKALNGQWVRFVIRFKGRLLILSLGATVGKGGQEDGHYACVNQTPALLGDVWN